MKVTSTIAKRTTKFAAAFAAGTAVFTGTAMALTSITFSPTSVVEVPTFPHVRDVSATFTHTGEAGDENLCKNKNGTTWELWVEDSNGSTLTLADSTTPALVSGQYLRSGSGAATCTAGTSKTETLAGVLFPAAGTYTLKGTLETNQGSGLDFLDEADLVLRLEQKIVVDFPAAPSVAADILKEKGVSARYGSGKSGGNYISDVAAHMGPQTYFNGVPKEDVEEYRAAVYAFLDATPAF